MCWSPQNRVCCPEKINLRGHMPRFTLKKHIFPSISLETPWTYVETIRTELVFLRRSICGVTWLSLLEKWMFPMYLLKNSISVCWNPQSRAHFSEVFNLRSHMSMFTWKMNSFLSISLENPYMCVETLRRGLVFQRWLISGVTCLIWLQNEWFPIYLLGIPINICWNLQNRDHFSKMINLTGDMPRFTLKMKLFPSISLETL